MPVVCYRLFVALWRELFGSLGDHCNIHLARLRRGSGTQPCMECGKGVTKKRFRLCLDCGYHKARMRAWQRDHRAFMV